MECMSDDIVKAFESMVIRTDFEDAFEVISGICDAIPPPSLINNIIFNILMENCEERIANEANAYLYNYLALLPLKSSNLRYYYTEALQRNSGKFNNIWSVFSHIVESCFSHYNIFRRKKKGCNPELVKYPNCDILIAFYTEMFVKFLSLENGLFEDNPEERFSILLEWINKVYKQKNLWPYPVLDSLHMLLEKKVNSDILYDAATYDFEAIVDLILNKCPDVFKDVEKIKGFFAKSNLPHVQLRICQKELCKLVSQKNIQNEMHAPLTLKAIMYNYFFFSNEQEEFRIKTQQANSITKKETNDQKQLKEIFSVRSMKGDTVLHEFCRKNQYGDLFEVLLSDHNLMPNAKNDSGFTPLHMACLSNSYYCVKFLLEEVVTDEKVDIAATNKNGLTPLHCAAYVDSVDIVQYLLKRGGVQLVKQEDKYGKKAENYAKSDKLKKLLEEAESTIQVSSNDKLLSASYLPTNLNMDRLKVAVMKDKNQFSIFLYCLHTILSNYLDMYNLYNSKKVILNKLSHKDCECPHYVSTSSDGICDEDAAILECLPQLLDKFFVCIQSNASSNEVQIHQDLLPLVILGKMFAG